MKKDGISVSLTPFLIFFYICLAVDFFNPLNETFISWAIGLSIAIHVVGSLLILIGVVWLTILLQQPINKDSVTFTENKSLSLLWTVFHLLEVAVIFYLFKYENDYFQKVALLSKFVLINTCLTYAFKMAHNNLKRKLRK